MAKIHIFSGFLGSGKTTLIRKLIKEAYKNEKIVLIENEFGDVNVDKMFLEDTDIIINEMTSGCICCTLVGEFESAIAKVIDELKPDRLLIEPSGVGKLSEILNAIANLSRNDVSVDGIITVVDAKRAKIYARNYGEFFNDQLQNSKAIILSHQEGMTSGEIDEATELIHSINQDANVITTVWDRLNGEQILEAMDVERYHGVALKSLEKEMKAELHDEYNHGGLRHHGHHHHGECCGEHEHHEEHHGHHHGECCGEHEHHEGHHGHHHHGECCGEHEHHEEHHGHHHGECCGEHEHHEGHHGHHHHGECRGEHEHHEGHHGHHHHGECCGEHEHHEGHHGHHHHGECCGDHEHHHADEVFSTVGFETSKNFSKEELDKALSSLDDESLGRILRCKGVVAGEDDWYYFDMIPGSVDIRSGSAKIAGQICIIGEALDESKLRELFLGA